MIRSFALTAAAITLRMYLPLAFVFHWNFSVAYPAIAWLCWIPNSIAAEVYERFVPTPTGMALPANLAGNFHSWVEEVCSHPPRGYQSGPLAPDIFGRSKETLMVAPATGQENSTLFVFGEKSGSPDAIFLGK
jgi:hypothetical protein